MVGTVKNKEEQQDDEKAESKISKEKVRKHKKKKVSKEDAANESAEPQDSKLSLPYDEKESAEEHEPKESVGKKDDKQEEVRKRQKLMAEKVAESKESDAASVKKTEELQEPTKTHDASRRRKIKDPDFFRKLFEFRLDPKLSPSKNDDESETSYVKKVAFENVERKPSSEPDPKATTKLLHHKRARNMKDFKKMLFESHLLDDADEDREQRKKTERKHDRKTPKRRWTIVIQISQFVCY